MSIYSKDYDREISKKIEADFFDPFQKQLKDSFGGLLRIDVIRHIDMEVFRMIKREVGDIISLSLGDSELK